MLKAARSRGFTLIELAVVLFVVTLILGSILVPLTSQVEQRQISDTRRTLEDIKEALMGYAVANGHLPCPAISATNGLENRTGTTCTANWRDGYIPWATLGVSKLDAWGNIFRYSVTPAYASSLTPTFTFSTPRDITIQTRDGGAAIINLTNVPPNGVPAVVQSYGKNGYRSVNDQGTAQALPTGWPASNIDEETNATTGLGTTFVSRVPQAAGVSSNPGEFDDIVVWISPNILFNRMVAAGKLP